MVSLAFVHLEWERDAAVRDRLRATNCLLTWHDPENPKVSISNADGNYHVLKPLVQRLRDPSSGDVGMHTLPAITKECLDFSYYVVYYVFFSSSNTFLFT